MILKLIQLVPDNTKIDFFGHRYYGLLVSCIIIFGSFGLMFTKGLNFGVDFTGGTMIEIQVKQTPDLGHLREVMNGLDLGDVSLQEFGAPTDLMIRLPQQEGGPEAQKQAVTTVTDSLNNTFPGGVEIRRIEFVGPQVGEELKKAGFLAIIASMAGIMAYIWFRFEWQYGVGAIIALIHDVVGTLGLFALTQMPFDLSTLAAVLLVAGYSINDTVIIYDRIRENLRKFKKMAIDQIINLSINQTLARTVMTSGTTLLAIFSLWLFGGEVIRGFVAALFFGIAIGTHSSYFIASPILAYLNLRRSKPTEDGQGGAVGSKA